MKLLAAGIFAAPAVGGYLYLQQAIGQPITADNVEERGTNICRILSASGQWGGRAGPAPQSAAPSVGRCQCMMSTMLRTNGRVSTAQILESGRQAVLQRFPITPASSDPRSIERFISLVESNRVLINNAVVNCR